jgi:hypothetical protein
MATVMDDDSVGWRRCYRAIRIRELYGDGVQKRRKKFVFFFRVFFNLFFILLFTSLTNLVVCSFHDSCKKLTEMEIEK